MEKIKTNLEKNSSSKEDPKTEPLNLKEFFKQQYGWLKDSYLLALGIEEKDFEAVKKAYRSSLGMSDSFVAAADEAYNPSMDIMCKIERERIEEFRNRILELTKEKDILPETKQEG